MTVPGNEPVFHLPFGIETRWANAENPDAARGGGGKALGGRKGSPFHRLLAGETFTMAHAEGPGMIRRIWITVDERTPEMLLGVSLSMYWDGESVPAVSVALADFFGCPFGRMEPFENVFFSCPDGKGFNCVLPMPFKRGMRIEATNHTDRDVAMFFYQVDFTLGDRHDADTGYLHVLHREESPTTPLVDYTLVTETVGRGRFLGCTLGIGINDDVFGKAWWGEGEMKLYLDGDLEWPTLCGTGTEEYIGEAWGMVPSGHWYQGCPLGDEDGHQYAFYRFHVPDPIYFRERIRVTLQQIGQCPPDLMIAQLEASGRDGIDIPGYGRDRISLEDLRRRVPTTYNIERYDDVVSTAYLYLDRP